MGFGDTLRNFTGIKFCKVQGITLTYSFLDGYTREAEIGFHWSNFVTRRRRRRRRLKIKQGAVVWTCSSYWGKMKGQITFCEEMKFMRNKAG